MVVSHEPLLRLQGVSVFKWAESVVVSGNPIPGRIVIGFYSFFWGPIHTIYFPPLFIVVTDLVVRSGFPLRKCTIYKKESYLHDCHAHCFYSPEPDSEPTVVWDIPTNRLRLHLDSVNIQTFAEHVFVLHEPTTESRPETE